MRSQKSWMVLVVVAGLGRAGAAGPLLGDCALFPVDVQYAVGREPRSAALGDLNVDGVPDLVVANYGSRTVSVLLGRGDGTFAGAVNYGMPSGAFSVAIGDLDGDHVLDLAVTDAIGSVSILLGRGDGRFSPAVSYAVPYWTGQLAIGDLNGDRALDLAVRSGEHVAVLLGRGDGTFDTAVTYLVSPCPTSLAISDVTGDQRPDLVMGEECDETWGYSMLRGRADGTFHPAEHHGSGGRLARWVAIGDLDGDQNDDLVIANKWDSKVSVLIGHGDGSFRGPAHYNVSFPEFVAIGDINGDQVPDLAVLPSGDGVSVLLGRGDGTFGGARNYGAGDRPWSAAIGDLNGDRRADLVVVNKNDGTVSILLNQCIPPAPPTDVVASDGDHGDRVSVTWEPSIEADDYRVYRNTENDPDGSEHVSDWQPETEFDDLSGAPRQVYWYWVKARTQHIESDWSDGDTGYRTCVRDPEWVCDGDVSGDGQVNPVDLGLVQANFGNMNTVPLCRYDLDCDGQINPVDSGIVQSLFGTCEAPRDVCP